VPGEANDISVGADGSVWIVDNTPAGGDFGIRRWDGRGWETMHGAGLAIAVEANGNPLLVDSALSIWRWRGCPYHQPGTYALGGDPDWQDVRLSVRLRSDSDSAIGVMFRVQDAENYYRFAMDRQAGFWRLVKRVGGVVSRLAEGAWQYTRNQVYEITLQAVGSELNGLLDGRPLFTHYDGDLPGGQVGLYCSSNDAARFERVVVTDGTRRVGRWTIHDEGDVDAPSVWRLGSGALSQTSAIRSATTDSAGTYVTVGQPDWSDVRLTARLRSDGPGAAVLLFRFRDRDNYYCLSLDAEKGSCRLLKKVAGQMTELWSKTRQGYIPGEVYPVTVIAVGAQITVLVGETPLDSIADASHSNGQIGLYCADNRVVVFEEVEVHAAQTARPYAGALLDEPFDELVAGRWSFEDFGDQDGPSRWELNAGELRQVNNIRFLISRRRPVPDLPATLAVAGDPGWSDYRLSVNLGSYPVLGRNPAGIGFVFRYLDADNFYWFSMIHANGYRALYRRADGQVTVLWQENAVNNLGQVYHLEIDCLASNLRGSLDGKQLFDLVDETLPSGRIGLECIANPGAFFGEAHVVPPVWRSYYTFRGEDPLPAGTRLRARSGSRANALAETADVHDRFIAAPGQPGAIHFPDHRVDLRLQTPDGQIEHLRSFLPSAAYTPAALQDWRILRKADGTGFFLFTAGGQNITPAEYRLSFTYRRDNR
jgi:hypothetical protein